MTTPLVDILQGLKRNTFAWAKLWVLNGAPDEFNPNEHHIITAALVPFRARYQAPRSPRIVGLAIADYCMTIAWGSTLGYAP
jgi:hypothetical protein